MSDHQPSRRLSDTEQLSALLDDELPEWAARQAIKTAMDDPQAWARLTEQQAALGQLPVADLLSGIHQQLDHDDQDRVKRKRLQRSHRMGFVQGAVAAGVVAALAVGIWPGPGSSTAVAPIDVAAVTEQGAVQAEVQDYWAQHARYATYGSGSRWDEVERSEPTL